MLSCHHCGWCVWASHVPVTWVVFLSPAVLWAATAAHAWRAATGSWGSSQPAPAQSLLCGRNNHWGVSGEHWEQPLSQSKEGFLFIMETSYWSAWWLWSIFYIGDVLEAEGWWHPSVPFNQNDSVICLAALRSVSFSLKFGAVVKSILSKSNVTKFCGVIPACTGRNWSSGFYGTFAILTWETGILLFKRTWHPAHFTASLTANLLGRAKQQHPI